MADTAQGGLAKVYRANGFDLLAIFKILGIVFGITALVLAGSLVNFARKGVILAPTLAPWMAPISTGILRAELALSQGRIPNSTVVRAKRIAARDPLAEEPFIAVGIQGFDTQFAAGNALTAQALEEALKRDPRSRMARIYLMRNQLASAKMGEAITQLAVIDRLNRDISQQVVEQLAKTLTKPEDIGSAVRAFGSHPALLREFVASLALTQRPASVFLLVADNLPPAALRDEVIVATLASRLVDAGEILRARQIVLGAAARGGGGFVDPAFEEGGATRPFGWEYMATETGVAERQSGGGVAVTYYGRKSGVLARQLMTLEPGGYRLTATFSPSSAEAPDIAVAVRCVPGATALGDARFTNVSRPAGLAFNVPPESCVGQWLEIVGLAKERSEEQSVHISAVRIER